MDGESPDKSKIVAIVVTYNRKELLGQCLEQLLAQQGASCDVLVVDNASSDGTREMVGEMLSRCQAVRYHNTGQNLGGAGGFQAGIKLAVEAGYQFVWLMDDDTWPENTALAELINAAEKLDGRYGFLSSTALWTDHTPCRMNRQKKNQAQEGTDSAGGGGHPSDCAGHLCVVVFAHQERQRIWSAHQRILYLGRRH